jgi:hypothetical protein
VNRRRRAMLLVVILSVLAVIGLILFFSLRKGPEEGRKAKMAAPAAQVGSVTLSREMQEKGGIETANPKPFFYREKTQAYVTVIDPGGLSDLRKSYLNAEAGALKAKATLDATREEYGRMKSLYEEKNVSNKAFQSAEASFRADEADTMAAGESVRAVELSANQQWGGTIAGWIKSGSVPFARLARREDVLLQVTLPQGYSADGAPSGLKVKLPSGKAAAIKLVSPAPRTDPHIQGLSFFYIASAKETGLLPGMSASAVFPSGQPLRGLVVPASAAVWWQGRAWAYVKTGADTFTRREVATGEPVEGGWFVSEGFSLQDLIVIKGAETLLSQEFLAKPAGGKEEDED